MSVIRVALAIYLFGWTSALTFQRNTGIYHKNDNNMPESFITNI